MTMTGEREQIDHLKALITQVVEEGSIRDHDSMGVQVGEGETLVYANMDIPSNRVGALIGRGGENITRLQADSGARLQLIQDESMGELKVSATPNVQSFLHIHTTLQVLSGRTLVCASSMMMSKSHRYGILISFIHTHFITCTDTR